MPRSLSVAEANRIIKVAHDMQTVLLRRSIVRLVRSWEEDHPSAWGHDSSSLLETEVNRLTDLMPYEEGEAPQLPEGQSG